MNLLDKLVENKVVDTESEIHSFCWVTIDNEILLPYVWSKLIELYINYK